MSMDKTEEIRLYLIQGLRSEISGDYDMAGKMYSDALHILASEYESLSPEDKKKRKKQISTLNGAIERLDARTESGKESGDRSGGLKILKELGIEPVKQGEVKLSDVIGLDDVKKEILLKVIYPLKFKELSEEYNVSSGGGILLYGPPGNGKTFIAKAVASEIEAYFIYVNPSVLYSQWFGNFEKNISSIFRAAQILAPSIIFFDEIDAMVPNRDRADSDVVRRGVSQFLNEMGGFTSESGKDVFIMGATNIPWNIDAALTRPGRFDRLIFVPPPDSEQRLELFRKRISNIRNSDKIDFRKLASATNGYSAADIDYVCRKAGEEVFLKAVEDGSKRPMNTEDFLAAAEIVKPSVNSDLMKRYEIFSKER